MPPLLKGFVIGFSLAAPVGPIGLLCLRRSLAHGRLAGFVSGLGAATADALYGLVAALGLTALAHFLVQHQGALRLAGGLFLLYLGLRMARTPPPSTPAESRQDSARLGVAYVSTLLLTLTNPATILTFLGLYAGLGLQERSTSASALVVGVFLGSAVWWLFLSSAAAWFGRKANARQLRWINLASGLFLAAFGVWQLFAPTTA
ncbi:MAG: LysE family translocator [Opitutus sp.]|nr:LysE family translocator [Opitutus sp.]